MEGSGHRGHNCCAVQAGSFFVEQCAGAQIYGNDFVIDVNQAVSGTWQLCKIC